MENFKDKLDWFLCLLYYPSVSILVTVESMIVASYDTGKNSNENTYAISSRNWNMASLMYSC